MNRARAGGVHRWAEAREVLETFLRHRGLSVDMGRVTFLGGGLSWNVYAADCDWGRGNSKVLVARVPIGADPELPARLEIERRVLEHVADASPSFSVARILEIVRFRNRVACIQEFARGVPVDLRAGRLPGIVPWQLVASVAAAVHSIPIDGLALPGAPTRRAACEWVLDALRTLGGPEGAAGTAWVRAHLPPVDAASTLVHGDLLGQNLLLDPTVHPGVTVLDWEYAQRGDPAYDLAVVTRGAARPFQIADGLARLLDEYHRAAPGSEWLDANAVHLHELGLRAGFVNATRRDRKASAEQAENDLQAFRSLLRRLGA